MARNTHFEVFWPLLSITKTNMENGLQKLRKRDLIDLVYSVAGTRISVKVRLSDSHLEKNAPPLYIWSINLKISQKES